MALYLEFDRIVRSFARAHVRYAVAGGFAVGLHGYVRATQDIDFLVNDEDFPKTDAALRRLGYRQNSGTQELAKAGLTLQRYFKRVAKEDDLMVVDLIIPQTKPMREVLRRAVRIPYRKTMLPVITAKDLIRMKLARGSTADKADIEFLRKRK